MSTNPWEDFARRSRELYQQQADLAKSWMEGQAKLAGTEIGVKEPQPTECAMLREGQILVRLEHQARAADVAVGVEARGPRRAARRRARAAQHELPRGRVRHAL